MSIRKISWKEAHHQTQLQTNDNEEIISHGQCSQIQTTGKLFVLWLQKKSRNGVRLHFLRECTTIYRNNDTENPILCIQLET